MSTPVAPSKCRRRPAPADARRCKPQWCTSSTNRSRPRSCLISQQPSVARSHEPASDDTNAQLSPCLVRPVRFIRFRSTTVCVAIPAWSVPGTKRTCRAGVRSPRRQEKSPSAKPTSSPRILRQRTRVSWILLVNAWPRCNEPVTLGGGMTSENRPFDLVGSAWLSAWLGVRK